MGLMEFLKKVQIFWTKINWNKTIHTLSRYVGCEREDCLEQEVGGNIAKNKSGEKIVLCMELFSYFSMVVPWNQLKQWNNLLICVL